MAKLGPAGRYAQREMTAALASLGMTPPPGSVARYAHAADRLAALRRAWEDAGSPATATGSREQVIAHPLLAEIRYTEATVTQRPSRPRAAVTSPRLGFKGPDGDA